jgi:quercetin dioxygenase-like cupin family protein
LKVVVTTKRVSTLKNNSENATKLKAQARNLIGLVDYQEGSVVSRTIINKGAGTVTLFAFGEGQGLSEHTAPYDALVHILDGEAEVVKSSKPIRLRKGDVTIIPANERHALKAVTRFKMILTMIRS